MAGSRPSHIYASSRNRNSDVSVALASRRPGCPISRVFCEKWGLPGNGRDHCELCWSSLSAQSARAVARFERARVHSCRSTLVVIIPRSATRRELRLKLRWEIENDTPRILCPTSANRIAAFPKSTEGPSQGSTQLQTQRPLSLGGTTGLEIDQQPSGLSRGSH
jgi:hypothetical protein